jgi:hypothetical protein
VCNVLSNNGAPSPAWLRGAAHAAEAPSWALPASAGAPAAQADAHRAMLYIKSSRLVLGPSMPHKPEQWEG